MIDPVSLVKNRSWFVSNFAEWQAMRKDIEEALEETVELKSVYSHPISPWINNGRSSELRSHIVRTGVWLDISQPHGEITEYEMEDGKKKLVDGKPVILDEYYTVKGKRAKYKVTISDVRYGPFEDSGNSGAYRRVYVSGTVEVV